MLVQTKVQQNKLATRTEFGATEMMTSGVESAATAMAAQAKAMVEARYIMALQRPRNWDQVRQDVLIECRRPAFAHNASALYHKPIGRGVEGLGIRFVEVALRCMANVLVETSMIFEDDKKEIHRVSVTDLENNLTYPLDVRIIKTIERSQPSSDGSYISVRNNSYGKPVYTVIALEDDLLNKRYATISKAIRTLGLRIIPGDIQDEAIETIRKVREDKAAADPNSERKRVIDAFSELGAKVSEIESYLGHSVDSISPGEIASLRGIYGAIRDGETSWHSVMESAGGKEEESAAHSIIKKAREIRNNANDKWPKKNSDGEWIDVRGMRFIPEIHGMSGNKPAVTRAGAFTKRRGCDPAKHAAMEREALEAKAAMDAEVTSQGTDGEPNEQCESEPTSMALADDMGGSGADAGAAPPISATDMLRMIELAKTDDELIDVEDLVRELDDDREQSGVLDAVASRRLEIGA